MNMAVLVNFATKSYINPYFRNILLNIDTLLFLIVILLTLTCFIQLTLVAATEQVAVKN